MKTVDVRDDDESSLFEGLTVYETLEELIGPEKTKHLCELFGGRNVHIPREPLDGHWLIRAVGWDEAQKLADHFSVNGGGCRLTLPRGLHHKATLHEPAIAEMSDKGMSASDIATAINVHVRTVYRLRHRINKKRAARVGKTVRRMHGNGLSLKEISEKMGFSVDSVRAIIDILNSGEISLRSRR